MVDGTTLGFEAPAGAQRGQKARAALFFASAALMGATLYLVFFWVPTERNLGVSQRIFYFHVPLGWLGMISIVIVAIASFMHLLTGREKWDSLAATTAELGLVFATLIIVTGSIWAKPLWGVWWTWDAKLTTTLILWFIYVSYLMLRSYAPSGSQGRRYSSVVALIGAIDAPIIYMATIWWRTAHPELNIGPLAESGGLDSRMQLTFLISIVAFTVLYAHMVVERYSLKRTEAALDELYQRTA
jgi:heme exporter protein C